MGVQQVVIGSQIGCLHIGAVWHFSIERYFVERRHLRVVQLLGSKHALFTDNVLCGVEDHLIERHLIAIPVVIAFLDDDAPVERPLGEFERTITDDIVYPGPRCVAIGHFPKLEERFRVHRERAVVIHQLDKVGRRCIERDLQRSVIRGLDADLVKVSDLAFEIGFGIDHRKQHVGVLVPGVGVKRAMPAPHIVTGGDLLSV